jgi:hypothetical protein
MMQRRLMGMPAPLELLLTGYALMLFPSVTGMAMHILLRTLHDV